MDGTMTQSICAISSNVVLLVTTMQMNVIATGCDQGLDAVLNRCWLLLQPAAVDVQLKGIGMAEAQLVASF